MLRITIPSRELFDERTYTFTSIKGQTIQLEHSLVSLAKWESKWKKPYMSPRPKTEEEFIDYIRCMTITQNVDRDIYYGLTKENIGEIVTYIEDPMSARVISSRTNPGAKKNTVTAELLYYFMFSFNIPKECEKWHLNRLLNLIDLFSVKNQTGKKKRVTRDDMIERRMLNEQRKAEWNTKG